MLDKQNIKNMYELSPLQKGILFHYIKDEGSSAYFEQMTLSIDGVLDTACLEDSLNSLIQKYDSLRTNFIYRQSAEPMQLVWKKRTAVIHYEDITHLTLEEQGRHVRKFQERDRETGFDLSRDLLIRFSLLKTGPDNAVLIWSHHHILMDGWCFGILFNDLLDFYKQRLLGQPLAVGSAVPYSRYIEWLSCQDEEEAAAFWAGYLKGYDQMTGIPYRLAHEGAANSSYEELSFTWNADVTSALTRLASRFNVTLNNIFQALWGMLLQRYNNTDDAVFGTVVSGRPANIPDVEKMVGLFINTIPVRISNSGETFAELVTRVQRDALAADRFDYLSLSNLQKQSVASGQLFDHLVVFENYPLDEQLMKKTGELGFTITNMDVFEQTNYPLHVLVMPGRELTAKLTFDTAVYDRAGMNSLKKHFTHLLEQVIERPDIRTDEIEIITVHERDQLLQLGSRIIGYPRDSTIQELFEQQSERTPDHLALWYGEDRITYSQLNVRANKLANYMINLGVRPGSLIGIAMERSIDLYVGILAILKTGGSYVPIDSHYPQDRIAYLMQDAELAFLLTHQHILAALPVREQRVICVDSERERIEAEEASNPPCRGSAEDLAYVMYTSGSTGKPKGVSVVHRGVVRLVRNNDFAQMDNSRTFLQLAPIAFDASTLEIWGSLLNGGCLAVMPPGTPTVEQIAEALRGYSVTTLWLTAGLFTVVVDHQLDALRGVKQLLVGGDVLSVPHVRKVLELGGVEVINGYGPTESTTFTCCYSIPAHWTGTSIPIGRPIMNTEVHVLDSRMKPVPPGIPGELYIGGDGLARGYYRRPDLTAERFMVNTAGEFSSRLYRTGDLVRFMPDGNLMFMGRIDNQVKIRGYRIEPGEIEAVLGEHPAVKEAVVHVTASKQLAAYVVPEHTVLVDQVTEWRRYLQEKLPDYMIPSAIMVMDALPLNPNGKVDRKSLPEPVQLVSTNHDAAPSTEMEDKLAGIWKEVLRLDQVGIHDNFFELGGDSIMAIQIAARLNRQQLKLNLQDLFQCPTIAGLAPHICASQAEWSQAEVTGKVPLTPIQHWFFEQRFAYPDHWNQAMLLPKREGWNFAAVRKSLKQLVAHHDALRMAFVVERNGEQDEVMQRNRAVAEAEPFLQVIDLTGEEEALTLMGEEANRMQRSLSLTDGQVLCAAIFNTCSDSYLFLIIHHLVVDGVSWRILLEDFEASYEQAIANRMLTLPPKTSSYQVWADRLRAYAEGGAAQQELTYWQRVCGTSVPPLPADKEGPATCLYQEYGQVTVSLDSSLTTALLTDAHRAYHTEINDILLAALMLSMKGWTEQERIALHMEGHGREAVIEGVDVTRTVGWFTSIYPVVLSSDPDAGIASTIQTVKETLRRIPQKGIGYGILRYLSAAGQELPDCQPEISFNYLGKFDQDQASGFVHAGLPMGELVSPLNPMSHQLELNGMVKNGRFTIQFGYNSHRFLEETISRLAERYLHHLRLCVEHCITAEETWTPSDFGLRDLTFEELDIIRSRHPQEEISGMHYLAPMQEGMLFHQLKDKSSPAYVEQIDFMLEGDIDPIYLEESVNGLIRQYNIFRTVFLYEKLSRPVQVVLKERRAAVKVEDVTHLNDREQNDYIARLKANERTGGFDLSRDLLLRFTLVKQGGNHYRLIWSFHHILIDGWCLGLVLDKLLELYQCRMRSQAFVLENTPSYGHFLNWLEKQNKADAQQFWHSYLQGFEQMTGIPQQELRADEVPYEKGEAELRLNPSLTAELTGLARSCKVTLNTVFRALWGMLLQKYNRRDDVVFGCVVAGRPSSISGVERMVGLFINTVPVRIQSGACDTFAELIRRVQEEATSADPYTYLSLSDIQSNTVLSGGLFDHIVAFENYPLDTAAIESKSRGLGFAIKDALTFGQTNYDLNVLVLPGDELTVKVSFNRSRFAEAWISRMLQHLEMLMSQVAARPDIRISELSIATEEEKNRLLGDFIPLPESYPREKTIHRLFEEQVERTPDHPAVVCGDKLLTYRQLDERANRLGHLLIRQGAARADIVGIMVKPSLEMITGILGVLKASGAYLPIDPAYPADRIAYMLEDSGTKLLLAQSGLEVPPGYSGEVILLDEAEGWAEGSSRPETAVEPEDLAYIIYTSGSTGRPKGVMVEHRSLVNLSTWHNRAFGVTSEDRSTKYAGFGFDASVWEVFPYLIAGAAIHIIKDEIRYDVPAINRYYEEQGITISFLPTQFAEQFMEQDNRSLRLLLIGGDRALRAQKKNYQIVNNYGPTENTVVATSHIIDTFDISPPIGRPISNNRIYIVDQHNQLQPIGVPGELCIAGEGLARGYWNQPELTQASFVPDPFFKEGLMYRTGDLARWQPDGTIDYVGRIDHQVKIRGHRIELGEIEHQLIRMEGVREAAVIARTDQRGQTSLCAYLIIEKELDTSSVRAALEAVLPGFMIPAHFVKLDAFPMTANGKLDRRAMPDPQLPSSSDHLAPETEIEQTLAHIWQDVLGIGPIGIHDHFFELGGDSIKAIQVAARLLNHELKLEVGQLFRNPTIYRVAPYITTSRITAEQGTVEGPVYLTPIQQWFFEQQFPEPWHWNQDMLLFRQEGYQPEAVQLAFEHILAHHDALRMSYVPTAEAVSQVNDGLVRTALELSMVDLTQTEDALAVMRQEADRLQRSLNLEQGPLVRLGLFHTAGGDYLLIIIHHLVVDGVSWRILTEDFERVYNQIGAGQPLSLPPKTSSFREWAARLIEYANSDMLHAEVPYWTEVTKGDYPALPADLDGPHTYRVPESGTVTIEFMPEETSLLLTAAHHAYKTEINDLLLTALAFTIGEWTGQSKIAIDLEGHGREEVLDGIDITRTVGWFTTMYPVVFQLNQVELPQAIKQVKETLRRIPNKGIGFGVLKYLTAADKKEGMRFERTPEISFNYLGQFEEGQGEGFGQAALPTGEAASLLTTCPYALLIHGMVKHGRLCMTFMYNSQRYYESTVKLLSERYACHIRVLIEHCTRQEEAEMTPSDYSINTLSLEEMDDIFNFLKEKV